MLYIYFRLIWQLLTALFQIFIFLFAFFVAKALKKTKMNFIAPNFDYSGLSFFVYATLFCSGQHEIALMQKNSLLFKNGDNIYSLILKQNIMNKNLFFS